VVATKSGSDPGVTVLTDTTNATTTDTLAPAAPADNQATPAQPDAQTTPVAVATADTIDYVVKQGETISALAAAFGTDVDTLRRLNYLVDDNIFSGQILHIPKTGSVPSSPATPVQGTNTGTTTTDGAPYRYTVQAGDTLTAIAQRLSVSSIKIIAVNNLQNPDNLLVGSQLIIPDYQPNPNATPDATDSSATPDATTGGKGVEHVVQPGEGLIQIAEKYGVDEAALAAANGITNRNLLRVGQKLIIPGITPKDAAKARGQIHVVQSGENLASIAVQYGVTVDEMVKLNNLTNPDAIYVGQELIVPSQ